MPYYTYVLLCKDGSLYTGYTKNVDKRIKLHIKGKGARYTRLHKPERLVYIEELNSRAEAMKRERTIKRLGHKQKLQLAKPKSKGKQQFDPDIVQF